MSDDVFSEHGLTRDEYERLCAGLGREPNRVELGIAGALWSEHCSYKSSKRWLREFPTTGPTVVQGPGENAGIVRLDGPWCLVFKIESHNHPSFIEPYHGAATGVGGILRDVFTMGARPIANLNSLRFGAPHHPRTAWLLSGVVRGISDYGNCVGVPTVGGEASFAPCYNGNILVNAMTVGLVHQDMIFKGTASGVGNPVFYIGSRTGLDGVHGATMASASFADGVEDQRPAVQVGDPFTEKLLLEASIELMASGAVVGIQDMGAAGLSSSSFEMAARAGSGLDLHLDRVPCRQSGLGPYELMLSESQERMLVVLRRGREGEAHAILRKWDLEVADIGVVTDTGAVRCYWNGQIVADVPVRLMVDDAPRYDRPFAPDPERLKLHKRRTVVQGRDALADLRALVAHPSLASKRWIYEQYDSTVQGNTVAGPGRDAAVIWVPEAQRAVAVTVEGNGRLVHLHPYRGSAHVVAEAYRNLACVGAVPLGATDGLNFGNPQQPSAMWEFVESVRGLAKAFSTLKTPVTGGNVSFYNETRNVGIWPTPMVGMVGLVAVPIERIPTGGFTRADQAVAVLGTPPSSLAGSAYLDIVHGRVEGALKMPRWRELQAMARLLRTAMAEGQITVAHDVAEGGLLLALAEMCFLSDVGFVGEPGSLDPGDLAVLFGEDTQSIVVAGTDDGISAISAMAAAAKVPCRRIGRTGGTDLELTAGARLPLADLKALWNNAIPALVRESES